MATKCCSLQLLFDFMPGIHRIRLRNRIRVEPKPPQEEKIAQALQAPLEQRTMEEWSVLEVATIKALNKKAEDRTEQENKIVKQVTEHIFGITEIYRTKQQHLVLGHHYESLAVRFDLEGWLGHISGGAMQFAARSYGLGGDYAKVQQLNNTLLARARTGMRDMQDRSVGGFNLPMVSAGNTKYAFVEEFPVEVEHLGVIKLHRIVAKMTFETAAGVTVREGKLADSCSVKTSFQYTIGHGCPRALGW